jgi:preprotein translocase subunit YajC
LGSLIIIIAMFGLLWFLLLRPQRAKQQQHKQMLEGVDVGDEVLSSGGVYGVVRGVDDDNDELHVEIAPGVEVRMDRRAVGAVVRSEASDDHDDEEDDVEAGEGDLEGDPEEIRKRSLAAAEAEIREESVNPVEDSVNDVRSDDAEAAVEQNRR